jgi:SAM-dependent methyltransferase
MTEASVHPCLVCGAPTRRMFDAVAEGFAVAACGACGSARTTPPLDADAMSAWYPQTYYGNRNVRFNPLFERMTRWFRRRRVGVIRKLTAPGAVLDVGCGRGFTLSFLRAAGYRGVGVELSPAAAHHARQSLGLDVRAGDFLTLPFALEEFDVIIFWHSLEHVADPMRALDRARELLRPGGLLVIAVPNFSSIQARLSGRQWFHLDVPRHYVHFSARGLLGALRRRGFRIVDVAHFSLEQNPYGWIQSLLNRVFRHNLLYTVLKEKSARIDNLRHYPLQTIATAVAGVLLLPLAMLLIAIETLLRRGGTVEVYARKENG